MTSHVNGDKGGLPKAVSWKVHPFTEHAGRSVGLIAIILVSAIGAFLWLPYLSVLLGAILFLVIMMAPYIFPTYYKMDRDGIEIKFIGVKTFRAWDEFRNFYPHDVGVHLSTLRKPGPLDPFRGSFIRFEAGKRDEILAYLEGHIKKPDTKNGETTADSVCSAEQRDPIKPDE